jgi:transposase InsO family protein
MIRRKKRKHCVRVGKPLRGADFGEPGVGAGFCARCGGVRASDPGAERGGCVHAGVSGVGSGHEFRQPESDASAGCDHGERGQPQAIRCDNGPELTSRHFLAWCVERQIELRHIQPGKPTQNARVESFHGRLREECLTVSWFQNLFDARRKIAAWKIGVQRGASAQQFGIQNPERVCRRRRPRASTQLSEGQGTQTPSLAPRAPPSRLKPEMEQQKVVVFLRERKQGAGQS